MGPVATPTIDRGRLSGGLPPAARVALLLLAFAALGPVTLAVAAGVHVVSPGDTLSGIAAEYGVSLEALAAQNGISEPDRIVAGQRIAIPASAGGADSAVTRRYYVVSAGDSLGAIADRFGITPAQLAAANGIVNPDHIVEGQRLTIATGGGAAAGPASTVHHVAPGETLTEIALRFGVALADLIRVNNIGNASFIAAGQALTIPVAALMPGTQNPDVRAILRRAEREFDIPDGLLQAIAWQESGWQQHVVSDAGAVGVTQLLPTTALWALEYLLGFVVDWKSSALDNARVGASVLRHYLKLTRGDVTISTAAYYQGWRSMEVDGMYDETRVYVANVLALWAKFR